MARAFKKTTRKKRDRGAFTGLGGVSGSYEKTYMAGGHYLGMIEKVECGERRVDSEPYILNRLIVLHDFGDGQNVVIQGSAVPHFKPGASPGDTFIKTGKFDYHLRDLKNFLITALDQDDDAVAEIAGQLWELIVAEKELPEDLEEYEDYVDEAETLEEVIEGVWNHARDNVVGEEQPLAGTLIEWVSTMKLVGAGRKLPEAERTADHYRTNTVYKAAWNYAEAMEVLSEDERGVLEKHLPDLEERLAAESAED